MALRALMLRKQIDDKNKALAGLLELEDGFKAREAELEKTIAEISNEEERSAVETEIEKFDADKRENSDKAESLKREISDLEKELEQVEKVQTAEKEERKENKKVEVRTMKHCEFFGMNDQERTAFFEEQETIEFLPKLRNALRDIRSIGNAGLTIPENMLGIVEPIIEANSKLMPFVDKEVVKGTAREIVQGTIPEAVWTEACANLNELDLGFNDVELDGYKVGGYYKICNALLEDNDVDLLRRVLTALAVSIAKAVDKAIIFGTGTKTPLGVATRLAQTSQPASYPATERAWVDLHTSNVKQGTGATGSALFKEIAGYAKLIVNDYFEDEIVWVMNKKTHLDLIVEAIGVNAAAAIVSTSAQYEMPVIGGKIVELSCIPDNNVVFGYFKAYKLIERKGIQLSQSEHYLFTADKTVVKGTARFDGKPVIAEAFAMFTITNSAATTSATFATDYANMAMQTLTVVSANGTSSGDCILTVSNKKSNDNTLKYAKNATANGLIVGQTVGSEFKALTSGTTQITAAAGTPCVVVELDSANRVVGCGIALANPKA